MCPSDVDSSIRPPLLATVSLNVHLAACVVMKCDGTGECADEIGNYFNLATTVVAASSGVVAQCVHGYFICCATHEMLRFLFNLSCLYG